MRQPALRSAEHRQSAPFALGSPGVTWGMEESRYEERVCLLFGDRHVAHSQAPPRFSGGTAAVDGCGPVRHTAAEPGTCGVRNLHSAELRTRATKPFRQQTTNHRLATRQRHGPGAVQVTGRSRRADRQSHCRHRQPGGPTRQPGHHGQPDRDAGRVRCQRGGGAAVQPVGGAHQRQQRGR